MVFSSVIHIYTFYFHSQIFNMSPFTKSVKCIMQYNVVLHGVWPFLLINEDWEALRSAVGAFYRFSIIWHLVCSWEWRLWIWWGDLIKFSIETSEDNNNQSKVYFKSDCCWMNLTGRYNYFKYIMKNLKHTSIILNLKIYLGKW